MPIHLTEEVSSGSSNVNSQLTLSGRDGERETNNPDSNVRKPQNVDVDKKETVPLGTEKSVATMYEESEDPTLLHAPNDTANEMLKSKILQDMSRGSRALSIPQQSSAPENLVEFVYVGNSSPQQGRRQIETHCSKFGRAKNSNSVQCGAGANQQPQAP